VLMMESNARKIKMMKLLLIAGLTVSIYYTFCLLFQNVTPQIMGYHIKYNSDFSKVIAIPAFLIYLVATITPLFISSIQRTHLMAVLMLFSCLVTAIFFTQYLTSVWCFFAALISGVIYWILSDSKKKFKFEKLNFLKEKLISTNI
jgi:hypothetical protein